MTTRRVAGWLVALSLFAPVSGMTATNVDEAKKYFEAGQKAFKGAKYDAAIAAFERAQLASPHPAIIFSLAQAHRLRYFVERRGRDLTEAARLYRRYLAEAPNGRRRDHAVENLATVEPLIAHLNAEASKNDLPKPSRTQLMVQSNVEGAKVFLDDRAPVTAPLIEEVSAGRHEIRVEADGHFPAALTRTAAEGTIAVVDVELKAKPAVLTIQAPDGAEVWVGGRRLQLAPLPAPVQLPEGAHRVEVLDSGRIPFVRNLMLGKGERAQLKVRLEATQQRKAAWWVLAGVGSLATSGAVVLGFAYKAQADAQRTSEKLAAGNALTQAEIREFQADKSRRNRWRASGSSLLSLATVGAVVGGLLYLVDDSTPTRVANESGDSL